MSKKVTVEECKELGYEVKNNMYLGPACTHGHNGWRYLSNSQCVMCSTTSYRKHIRQKEESAELSAMQRTVLYGAWT